MNLRFEKVTKDGIAMYFINGKPTDENTYYSLLEDKKLNTIPADEYEECNEDNLCSECEELLGFIEDIAAMENRDAIDALREELENSYNLGLQDGAKIGYENICKIATELSDRIEVDESEDF